MQTDVTLWSYFLRANFLIQLIFIVLFLSSLASWCFIFQRWFALKSLKKSSQQFEKEFWSDVKLSELYERLPELMPPEQLSAIFYAGFTEFCRLRNNGCQNLTLILEGVQRAMRIAENQAAIHLERHVHWLAINASSSPYLGLIGTLVSITSALSLHHFNEINSLSFLATGISEALTISLFSLLTAFPATIFYHSYTKDVDRLLCKYHIFQEEFIELLLRQSYEEPA